MALLRSKRRCALADAIIFIDEKGSRISSTQPSHRTFVGIAVLLFGASTVLTISYCNWMSAMQRMPISGGRGPSMMWMCMPGQTWSGVVTSFIGMWLTMMVAMMMPSLMPMLWRYRHAVGVTTTAQLDASTALVGASYFFVWTLFGAFVFLVGATFVDLEMHLPVLARTAPASTGAIVAMVGIAQFSRWKIRHLARCRGLPACGDTLAADAYTAWRHGLRLGLQCVHCCFGFTVLLLVMGIMDLRAMVLVTVAISIERLAPGGMRASRVIGAILFAVGVLQIARVLITPTLASATFNIGVI